MGDSVEVVVTNGTSFGSSLMPSYAGPIGKPESLLRRSKIFIEIGSEPATSSVGAAYRRPLLNKPGDRLDGAPTELRTISRWPIL